MAKQECGFSWFLTTVLQLAFCFMLMASAHACTPAVQGTEVLGSDSYGGDEGSPYTFVCVPGFTCFVCIIQELLMNV